MAANNKKSPKPPASNPPVLQPTVYSSSVACQMQILALILGLAVIAGAGFWAKEYNSFYVSSFVQSIANLTIFLGVQKETHTRFICRVVFFCRVSAYLSCASSIAGITSHITSVWFIGINFAFLSVPLLECFVEQIYFDC